MLIAMIATSALLTNASVLPVQRLVLGLLLHATTAMHAPLINALLQTAVVRTFLSLSHTAMMISNAPRTPATLPLVVRTLLSHVTMVRSALRIFATRMLGIVLSLLRFAHLRTTTTAHLTTA